MKHHNHFNVSRSYSDVEEMADVLMSYNDILLCYDISSEELKEVYTKKFEKNMERW